MFVEFRGSAAALFEGAEFLHNERVRTNVSTEDLLSDLGRLLKEERSLGIEAHKFTDDEVRLVDGQVDSTDTYMLAMMLASKLALPGWWPTRVVAAIEGSPFNYDYLSKGEYRHLASAEAFADRRRRTLAGNAGQESCLRPAARTQPANRLHGVAEIAVMDPMLSDVVVSVSRVTGQNKSLPLGRLV